MTGRGTFIVIPAYREMANLPELVESIHGILPKAAVLVVDDASGDGTPDWARGHPRAGRTVFLLERPAKSGFASALEDGHRFALKAGAETVVQMDADFSHDPADLPRLVAAVRAGADLAVGSRYCEGGGIDHWSWWRRGLSRAAGAYVRFWTGLPLCDPTAGFRAFGPSALESALSVPKRCDGYGFQIEMALAVWRNGGVLEEIPVVFSERREGCSKLSAGIIREAVLRVPGMR